MPETYFKRSRKSIGTGKGHSDLSPAAGEIEMTAVLRTCLTEGMENHRLIRNGQGETDPNNFPARWQKRGCRRRHPRIGCCRPRRRSADCTLQRQRDMRQVRDKVRRRRADGPRGGSRRVRPRRDWPKAGGWPACIHCSGRRLSTWLLRLSEKSISAPAWKGSTSIRTSERCTPNWNPSARESRGAT